MGAIKIVLIGILTAAASLILNTRDFSGKAYSQSDKTYSQSKEKDDGKTKIDPATAKKLREARIADINKKLTNISLLIQNINVKLESRSSGDELFDSKRSLENQLRDLITLFALTDRAIREAGRLTNEVFDIRKNSRKGLRDPRFLNLANFLDARRREYILFATR